MDMQIFITFGILSQVYFTHGRICTFLLFFSFYHTFFYILHFSTEWICPFSLFLPFCIFHIELFVYFIILTISWSLCASLLFFHFYFSNGWICTFLLFLVCVCSTTYDFWRWFTHWTILFFTLHLKLWYCPVKVGLWRLIL